MKRFLLLNSCVVVGLLSLSSCANSPLGNAVQRSLAPDPTLAESPLVFGRQTDSSTLTSELPSDFPSEIPLYPNAQLVSVSTAAPSPEATASPSSPTPSSSSSPASTPSPSRTPSPPDGNPSPTAASEQTVWTTSDSAAQVTQFYQRQLQQNGWQLQRSPDVTNATDATATTPPILANRNGLQVAVEIPAASITDSAQTNGGIEFSLSYRRTVEGTAANPAPSPSASPLVDWWAQAPSATRSSPSPSPTPASETAQQFSDINQAPDELQTYINDLAKLGVLSLNATANSTTTSANLFKPNQSITRRDYARWLVATNNRLYSDRPANKIRLGVASDQSAFQDVPRTDPDFGAIQGLAEAGLIPSPLSGASTTVNFRPDAPLTREDLIRWKTPLDVRQTLPTATVQAVQETWGFQDASRIDPSALRAILADYQNGDLSNIRRAFGFTTLFQPKKEVTRAEAAATLWYFGYQGEGISAEQVLKDTPTSP